MSISFSPPFEDEFEPEELVRKFSLTIKEQSEGGVEEETEIKKALLEDFEAKENRRKEDIGRIKETFESIKPRELIELSDKRKSLEQALQDFCTCVQKQYPEDISPKLDSWEDVTAVTEKIMARLERKQNKGKFRSATKHLRTFCNTIKCHSTALKMIPTNNQYVSVFYGALATTIQASETYTNIMEILPQALSEINDAVSAIEKEVWLFDSDAMKSYAWRMYSQIFNFLGEIIRWYTKRSYQRLLSSFNEHLPEFFEDQVNKIQKLAQLIHQEANSRSHADGRISRLYLEGIDEKFERLMMLQLREQGQRIRTSGNPDDYQGFYEMTTQVIQEKFQEEVVRDGALKDIWIKFIRRITGSAVADILEDHAREDRQPQSRALRIEPDNEKSMCDHKEHPDVHHSAKTTFQPGPPEITRDSLLSHSANMEMYFKRDQIQIDDESSTSSFFADSSIVSRIQSWATSTDSGILYIAGIDSLPDEESLSSVAAYYAYETRNVKIPVCSYFCRLSHEDPPKGRTRETIELTALVYSLIRQLIELLPSTTSATSALLDFEIFKELEGTLDTFPKALDLLDSLMCSIGPPIVFFVVDGLDQLDDLHFSSTEKWLKRFVEVLLKHAREGSHRVVKMMFTTRGISAPLFEALDPSELLLVNALQRRKGRRSLGEEPLII